MFDFIVSGWYVFVGFLEQILVLFAVLTGSMFWGIVVFTFLARMLLLPLTLKSIRSSREMQKLQPMIKELQRKYGKDQQKLQEETLKLYREHKVNPVGGCLPMLAQMPIFIGVYQAIIHLMIQGQQKKYLSESMREAVVYDNPLPLLEQPFLGPIWSTFGLTPEGTDLISSLLNQTYFSINLGLAPFYAGFSEFNGWQYLVLPVLAVVFQVIQQLMAMPRVQDPQQKMMSQVMLIMPLFLGYIGLTFPAGAVLYWVTSSLIGIVQQYFISGWGSLANYLTFLPVDEAKDAEARAALEAKQRANEDGGGSGAPAMALAGATSGGGTVQSRTFWDILAPLTEERAATRAAESEADEAVDESTAPDSGSSADAAHGDTSADDASTRRKQMQQVQRQQRGRSSRKGRSRRK